jgi:aldehyde dehydrogenase (NAD+)
VSASSPSAQIASSLLALRASFESGRTRSYEWRQKQLDGLIALLVENEERVVATLREDVGKTAFDAWSAEVADLKTGLLHLKKNLRRYMKPEKVSRPRWPRAPVRCWQSSCRSTSIARP